MSPSTAVRMEEANDTEITLGTGKMLALFFGLVSFLHEIHIATRSLRIGPH